MHFLRYNDYPSQTGFEYKNIGWKDNNTKSVCTFFSEIDILEIKVTSLLFNFFVSSCKKNFGKGQIEPCMVDV